MVHMSMAGSVSHMVHDMSVARSMSHMVSG